MRWPYLYHSKSPLERRPTAGRTVPKVITVGVRTSLLAYAFPVLLAEETEGVFVHVDLPFPEDRKDGAGGKSGPRQGAEDPGRLFLVFRFAQAFPLQELPGEPFFVDPGVGRFRGPGNDVAVNALFLQVLDDAPRPNFSFSRR